MSLNCFILLLPGLAFGADSTAVQTESGSPIVAEIGEQKITRRALDEELARVLGPRLNSFSPAEQHELALQVLSRMIDRRLILDAAAARQIAPSEDLVEKSKRELVATLGSTQAFEQFLTENNLTEKVFLEGVREDVIINRFIELETASKANVSDREVKEAYEKTPERFAAPTELRIRQLLIRVPEDADQETQNAARERIDQIAAQIEPDGANFEKLVKLHSEGPKKNGGDLGFVTREQLPKELADTASTLKKGQVSSPIKSALGFHILLLEDRRGGTLPPFEEAKEKIRTQLQHEKQTKLLSEQLEKLREGGKVIVYIH